MQQQAPISSPSKAQPGASPTAQRQLSQTQLPSLAETSPNKKLEPIKIEKSPIRVLNSSASQGVLYQPPSPTKMLKPVASATNKGKKTQSSLGKKLNMENFSLQPYHEKIVVATAPKEVEQSEDEYGDYGSERDPSNDEYWFTSSDEDDDEYELDADEIKWRADRLTMYAKHTHYDVIKEVAKFNFEYHLTKRENRQWDIGWFDGPITMQFLQRMLPYQRTNHLPGIYNLAKKNMLGRHLMRLQSIFPDDYNFFPQTYNLPADFKEFLNQVNKKRNRTFIVKPEASCQGKGIFLTRDPESLTTEKTMHFKADGVVEHMVVQRYMHKPYLIDGFKFDLRIYVLVNGISPLRVYVFNDGLARFATVKYQSPAPSNLNNLCMHLTNYAINKESVAFVQNTDSAADDVGSKRSYKHVLDKIQMRFGSMTSDRIKNEINDIIGKTLCLAQPHVHHLFRSCHPDDMDNSLCFQILGFDIMIDHKLKPSLIEVNQMPSFQTDSPLDHKIKFGVINDCIAMLDLSEKRRRKVKNQKRMELQRRLLQGYSHKISQPGDGAKTSKSTLTKDKEKQAAANKDKTNLATAQQEKEKEGDKKLVVGTEVASTDDKGATLQANAAIATASDNKPAAQTTTTANNALAKEPQSVPKNQNQINATAMKVGGKNQSGQTKNLSSQVSKLEMRTLAMQSKQGLIIRKRLQREKTEAALCGGYELIYPFVSYEEEELIKTKVALVKQQGNQARSIKNLIGLNAPKTLKEKLAEKEQLLQKDHLARQSSQKSLEEGQEPPEFGEGTIEHIAVKQIMEEAETDAAYADGQQGSQGSKLSDLDKRWLKQMKYENFMECARKMWDQFTSGAQVKQQRRKRAQAEMREKQQADKEKQEKHKRDQARKQLTTKLRKQAEERRRLEVIRMMNSIDEEEEELQRERSLSSESMKGRGLNMAVLRREHDELKYKIDESRQKVLEEGLRRHRKSSQQQDRQEVRKSLQNLSFDGAESSQHNASQKTQSISMSRVSHKPSNQSQKQPHVPSNQVGVAPNMDYFKIILQKKYADRQQKRQKQLNDSQEGSRESSIEDDHSKSVSVVNLFQSAAKEDQAHKSNHGQQKEEQNAVSEVKPKTKESSSIVASTFPLDSVLPVFKLNRPVESPKTTSNQVQTLKLQAKKDQQQPQQKDRRGLIKGSTVNTISNGPQVVVASGKKPMADQLGYGHLRTQTSQALLNPVLNKAGAAASYGISSGQGLSPTFRHRKMTEAQQPQQPVPVGQVAATVEAQKQQQSYTQQKLNTDKSHIPQSLKPTDVMTGAPETLRIKSDQLKRDIDVIRNIGSNRGKPPMPSVAPLEKQSRSNIFKSLEPMETRVGTHSKPITPQSATIIQENHYSKLKTREPHVIMIDLDVGKKKDAKQAQFRSPQLDNVGVQPRKEQFMQQNNGKSNSIQHQSNKLPIGSNDVVGGSIFVPQTRMAYQRNSKMNEIFGGITGGVNRFHQVGANVIGQQPLIVTQSEKKPGLDVMHNQKPNISNFSQLGYLSGGQRNSKIAVNSELARSLKNDNPLLPELAQQHRSKEISFSQPQSQKKSRTTSMKSQLNSIQNAQGTTTDPYDLSQSYQLAEGQHRQASGATNQTHKKLNPIDALDMFRLGSEVGSPEQVSLPQTRQKRVPAQHKSFQAPMDNTSIIYHMESNNGGSRNPTRNTTVFSNRILSEANEPKIINQSGYSARRFSAQHSLQLSNNLASQNSRGADLADSAQKNTIDLLNGLSILRKQKATLERAGSMGNHHSVPRK